MLSARLAASWAKVIEVDGLKIELFGEFRVRRGEEPVERREWDGQKSRSLLKLLLTRPGRVFSADEIVEALWPGASPQAAKRRLRITVSQLRRTLEPDLKRGSDSRYVLSQRPGYLFDRRAEHCEVDAWEFEELQGKAEAAREAGNLDEAIEGYRAALELWRGEFLGEDPYEEWAISAREEWQERRLSVLSELAECLALKGRYTEAIEACNRALALGEYREGFYRRLMLYHYCAGEQALALRTYRDYARMLKEDLGATPSPELAQLKEHIEVRDVPGVDALRRYPKPRRPLRFPYSLSRTHFVGRDKEYALLEERLKEATEGFGGAIAVEGEAGVGKTRLAEEFLGYARYHGARVLSGRCYERELGPPLEPIMEALDPVVDIEKTILCVYHAGTKDPAIPQLDVETRGYLHAAPPYHDGSRIYQALTRELIREARTASRGALVLFVDDVQWADSATLGFLSYLAKRISDERIVLIVTFRREDAAGLSGWMDRLAERRAITTFGLNRLSLEDTTELLTRMSSRAFAELPRLAGFLQRESEGNPFYAVEYLRWLIEAGAIEMDSRRRISGLKSELLQGSTLPFGVRSLAQARLRGLNDEVQELLKLASVIGRTFDIELLCGAAARRQAGVFGIMESLIASGLIVEAAEGKAYYFSHDKLRQAVYEDIGSSRRRELHLRVASALEKSDSEPAELAHHYLRAQAWQAALENLVRAARKAEESYAWETALKNYVRALEITEKLPDSDEERFELLVARENLLEHMDHRVERAKAVREMFELASRSGTRARIAEVHIRRMGVLMALSDPEGAREAAQAAVAIFRELGDRTGEAKAHQEMGYVCWMHQDYAGSLEANFQALRIHRELGNRQAEAGDVGNLAQVYRSMGDHEQALKWAGEAASIYHELGDKLGEAVRISTLAAVHRERGDLEVALSLNLKTLQFNTELGVKNLMVAQHITCGRLYLSLGAPEKALDHFQAAARFSREIGYTRDEGHSLISVGASLEQVEDHAGAADTYRRAIEVLDTAYEASGLPEELAGKADALTLLAGALHRSLDQPVKALEAYEAAAKIYRKLGYTRRLRRPLLGLSGLRWRMGNLKGSARGYEEALSLAQEHGENSTEVVALASLSVVYRDQGCLKESIRCGRGALRLLGDLNDPQAEAYVLSSLAESYGRLGHYPSALSCLKRSLRLRKNTGDKEGEVGALEDLAKVYENLGDPDRARACSEEAFSKKGAPEEAQVAFSMERRN